MPDSINICIACDDNYSKYAGVVIASTLANASNNEDLTFYILDGGISEEHKEQINSLKSIKDCNINFVPIDESMFEDYKQIKTHDYITIAAYYRLKLPSLLPDVSKIIYFDCDFVINSDLYKLFNVDMGNFAIAGVKDINKKMVKKNPNYVNSGMLVFNLDKMREQNLEEKFLDWTREHKDTIYMGDQQIINEVLKGQIKIVDDEWNVQSSNFTNRSSYTRNPKTIHFVARKKPWHFGSFSYHRALYFKYLQMTPWKLNDKELKHWTRDNQIVSLLKYVQYRPLFMLRPRFYQALFFTYILPITEKIFSIKDYGKTHKIMTILGIKIKYPKADFLKKKKQSPYYYYKKNNIDITTLPPAEGQIRDIQLANLVLLKELDYVCKENGLKYWLDAGTLIGAIRHKGFIPWDDDIDTAMVREDYNKIIDAFRKSSKNPDIFAAYYRSPNNTCQYHIKIQHKKCPYLFVDIFPFDLYGEKQPSEIQIKNTNTIKQYRKELEQQCQHNTSDRDVKHLVESYMREKVLVNPIPEDKNNAEFVWGLDFNHSWNNWFTHYDVIFPLKTIEFEGQKFPCMNNPDAFLTRVYGNYMSYPKNITMGHAMFLELSDIDKEVINNLKLQVLNDTNKQK